MVEVFYANIGLQSRVDCIDAFCHQDAFPFEMEFKREIESILADARKIQAFRNLLAHNFILEKDILIRGKIADEIEWRENSDNLFVWKTNRKGKYEVRPLSEREVEKALESMFELGIRISVLCASIRMKYGIRP